MADENVIEGNAEEEGIIPAEKIQEAHAICMQDPKLATYFNEAPYGAKQYIALMFYCTVFSGEVDDDLCAKYQQEVEEDLTRDDALYLATRDTNPISKAHFRELYLELKRAEEAPETAHQENVVEVSAPSTTVDATSLARVEQELVGLRAEVLLLRRFLSKMLALGLVLGVLGLVAVWVAIVLRFAV